ncbi:MAG: MCE family protein [Verrucomicrobia bacterium]|nr:MCE family protein [Verrucomicrobiota bacterium]
MGEQTKNMLIGVFVIAACGVIIWLIMFLKPGVGDGKETLYVRFSSINQINVGTRVLFAGRPVGEVVAIQEINDARQKPTADVLGEIYCYQLVLKVDSSVKVYDTDEIIVQTTGLLGEKSIAIIPKIPPKGVTPKLVTNQPIYAKSVDPIENAFTQLSNLSKDMRKTFQRINGWIQKNGDDLGNTVRSFGSTMDEIKVTVKSLNEQNLAPDIKTAIHTFTSTLNDVKDSINQLKAGDVFVNAGVVMKNLKSASHNVKNITGDIADGKGTLGKLIKSDDFYLHMQAILSKVDTLMNDINHYGILFHLNKSWQRQRAQRITVLNALNTPDNFKSYFETEVSQINTSMSRISMLIDKAEESPEKEEILSDERFRKDFKELLRQADELSENLRLYNQQLSEAAN